MKLFILLGALCLLSFYADGQIVYFDIIKDQSIRIHGEKVRSGVGETDKSLSRVKARGLYIQAKLKAIKESHSKLRKGLQDVSALVSDGLTAKDIMEITADLMKRLDDTRKLAAKYPQYVVFANGAINRTYNRTLTLSAYVSNLTLQAKDVLMDAGERKDILNTVLFEVRMLRASLHSINNSIEQAVDIGILKSMNPFNNYVHRDANIMRKIMEDASAYR